MAKTLNTGKPYGVRDRQIYSGRMADVSVWLSELQEGTLPPVCVKSGQPADSKLKFRFSTTTRPWYNAPIGITVGLLTAGNFVVDPGARHYRAAGWLPFTRRWRATFIALRAVTITAAAAALLLFIVAQQLVPAAWGPFVLGLAAGAFAVFVLTGLLYSALRPKGGVHEDASKQRWVHLLDVHPNFVAAVEAMEAAAANSQAAPSE